MRFPLSIVSIGVAASAWAGAARADDAAPPPAPTSGDGDLPAPAPPGDAVVDAEPSSHELTIAGYVQPQLRFRQDDPVASGDEDGFRIRRGRVELVDRERWARLELMARVELEVAGTPELMDGYVSAGSCLRGRGHWELDAGQLKVPFSREEILSDARLSFVEKPDLASLAPDRQMGAAGALTVPYLPWVNLSGGVFDGEGRNQSSNVDQRFLWAGRAEVRPLGRKVALAESDLGGDYVVVGGSLAQNRVQTGNDVERVRYFGGDVAFGWHGLSGEAEYLEVHHHRRNGGQPDFHGNGVNVQLAYLLPLPGRWAHHLELGARMDEIDRNDTIPIERPGDDNQSLRSYHLAATWYQHGHDLKLQVDAAHIVEVEAITRNRVDATYDNDTVLIQATYRLEMPK
ncbi:MAG TPA: porin [Kofleriaceae bacterium]|nr:porin [Kofleriaceae bacterium]